MEHGAQQGMRRGWLRVMVTVHRLIMQLVKAHQRKKPRAKKSTKNKARSKNKKKKRKEKTKMLLQKKKKSERRWKTRKFRQRQTGGLWKIRGGEKRGHYMLRSSSKPTLAIREMPRRTLLMSFNEMILFWNV